jgi:hypothetical protein
VLTPKPMIPMKIYLVRHGDIKYVLAARSPVTAKCLVFNKSLPCVVKQIGICTGKETKPHITC